jgi:hypothetical protein
MNTGTRRFLVSILDALEIPLAVAAGAKLFSDFPTALVLICAAVTLKFIHTWLKPYFDWQQIMEEIRAYLLNNGNHKAD